MRIYVLGDIRAKFGDRPVSITNERQQRILVSLLIAGPGGLGVDQLVSRVWDETDEPPDAVRSVRTYVNRLRNTIGVGNEGPVATRPGGYVLKVEPGDIDSYEFERIALEASSELDPYVALEMYDEALRLWSGPAYGQLAHLDWIRPEAVRLEELRLAGEEARLNLRLDAGRHADVAADAERLIFENPYREQLMAVRATALYRSGRQVEALQELEQHRSLLREDLGVDPTPQLQDLEVRILTNDPNLTPSQSGPRSLKGYRLGKQIGEGAYSVVYRATQPSVGREVAVKVIRRELANEPTFIRRFGAEAQLVARLQHPRIVPLYDFWREANNAFLVMPWLEGGSLAGRLRLGPIPLEDTVRIVTHVASGLQFAHSRGVIHRDIKPSNVLLDGDGNGYISDFGIALTELSAGADDEPLLSTRSPAYVAPESFSDSPVGPASDVYALAILTFEMLSGTVPWPESTLSSTLRHQRSGLPPMQLANRDWSQAINEILSSAASPEPTLRPPSPSEFAEMLAGIVSDDPPQPVTTQDANPYRGLAAFEEPDAPLFFGREELIEEVVNKLSSEPLVLLVGPSGSGKSSLLRAGVIPVLRAAGRLPVVCVPSQDPIGSLAVALRSLSTIPSGSIRADLEAGESLTEIARSVAPEAEVVVAVDQLEELFTASKPDAAEQFLAVISTAVTVPGANVRVIAAIRADFFGHPLASPTMGQLAGPATVTIGPMRSDQLAAAISEPARRSGVEIEKALVAELAAETTGRAGTLPFMQFALTKAWEERSGPTVTLSDYERLGGLTGTLVKSAEATYGRLEPAEQDAAGRLLPRLVQFGDETTRRREEVGAALSLEGVEPRLIEALVEARLVTLDRDQATREPTIELSHEALIEAWPRLARWVEESGTALRMAQRLRVDAAEWVADDRPPDLLYSGSRLVAAREAEADPVVALAPGEKEFLDASAAAKAARDEAGKESLIQEERQRRRRRLLTGIAAIAAIIGVIAVVIAIMAQRRASDESATADFAQLISRATELQTTQNDLALLLAAEAYAQDPGLEAQRALLGALQNVEGTVEVWEAPRFSIGSSFGDCYSSLGPGQFVVRPNQLINGRPDPGGTIVDIDAVGRTVHRVEDTPLECNVHRSPGTDPASWLYVGSNTDDETIVLASDGEIIGSYPGFALPFFDGRGRLLAKAGGVDGVADYVELDPLTGDVLNDQLFEAEAATLSKGGKFIVAMSERTLGPAPDSATLIDSVSFEVVVDFSEETGRATRGATSPDDSRFGYVSRDDRLLVWDTDTGQLVIDVPVPEPAEAITLSPDGISVAVLTEDGTIRVHSGEDGENMKTIDVDREPTMAIDWALEDRIAVLRSSGVVDLVALDGGGLFETGPRCCDSDEFGTMVADGIPNAFAVYADLATGTQRYVDVATGEESVVDVSPWVLERPGADMYVSRYKTTTLIRPPFEIFRVDLEGNAEAPQYPFGDSFVLRDDVPDIARYNLHGGDEYVFLKLTEGSVSTDRRTWVLEELQIGVINIDTMEVVVSPNLIDLRDEDPKVDSAELLPGGILIVGQELDDGRRRQQYFTAEGERLLEFTLPHTDGWWVLTPDHRYILTANADQDEVRRWNVETGESVPLSVLGEPRQPDMLSDGKFMIQSRSGQYELWDIESASKIGVLADPGPRAITDPVVHPDESHVWIRLDGLWTKIPLDPERWFELACEFAGRSLTETEWRDLVPGDRAYRNVCGG